MAISFEEPPGGDVRTRNGDAISELTRIGPDLAGRWALQSVIGTAFTLAGIAYVTTAPLAGIALASIGLFASIAFQNVIARTSEYELRAYDGVVAIGLDLLALYVMIAAVGLSGIILFESALFAIVTYTVVLLCSLIKSNALKVSPIKKALRIGTLAKVGIGFVLLVSIMPRVHAHGLPLMTRDFANIVSELLAAFAMTISVHRAARVGSRFARRDPTPVEDAAEGSAARAAAAA